MTQCIPMTLPGSPAGKVVHSQVHDLVKRLVPSGESKVVRGFLSLPDQVVLKEEVGADFYHYRNRINIKIMKRMISIGLWIVGGLLLLVALVSGGASILSLLERVQHGPGLLFADVEFFGFIALTAAILGVVMLFVAKKLSAFGK